MNTGLRGLRNSSVPVRIPLSPRLGTIRCSSLFVTPFTRAWQTLWGRNFSPCTRLKEISRHWAHLSLISSCSLKGSTSALKRDEVQSAHQPQLAAALNAIGAGDSTWMSEEIDQSLSEEARRAIQPIAEGIHLLADLLYRLSLQRKAFIKPALNFLGKNTADSAPIDEWLFGTSFAEEIKEVKACEKVARELCSKPKPLVSKAAVQQLSRAQLKAPSTAGNSKGPTRQNNPPPRRSGARSKDRSRKSASRSRYCR